MRGSKWIDTGKGAELRPADIKSQCTGSFVCKNRKGWDIRVPCGRCETCKRFKLTNMVGMLQAEAKTSGSVWFLSLTYADDAFGHGTFYYRHVSNMLKSLRHVYPGVRFFAVGEKGDLNKRNHWHLLLFFPDWQPIPELRRGIPARYGRPAVPGELWKYWPHGFASFRQVKTWEPRDLARQVRYCALYMYKGDGKGEYDTVRAHWSCKPVLGAKFLEQQADQYALINEGKLRLPLYISFAGDRVAAGGQLWKYPILGARRGHYIRRYYATCRTLYGHDNFGGYEVDEKIARKDFLGAAEDKRLCEREALLKTFRKMRFRIQRVEEIDALLQPKKKTLSEKWKEYDRKLEQKERAATYAAYSFDIADRGRYSFVEPDCYGQAVNLDTGEIGYADETHVWRG